MRADRDLVQAACHGDREAFCDLIGQRVDRLFAVAHRILQDIDRAEDALQDALVIAWRDLRDLRDPDRFDAWVQRLLIRTCIRAAVRDRRTTVSSLNVLSELPTRSDPLQTVAHRDQLERGFQRLPAEQRAILVLRHFADLETAEIAEVLGIPHGTVRSRLHHAHREMRAALEADARVPVSGEVPG
jgi:RNA polymerase sigma-70 factor (ECF subfamily)